MRLAVQLFGHLRTFERCAVSLHRHLLDDFPDADVFLHTWDRQDHTTVTHHAFRGAPTPIDERLLAAVEAEYRPVRLLVESQTPSDRGELEFANGKRMAIAGVEHMLQSMHRANQLRVRHSAETGTAYDLVVVTRPDIVLRRKLDLASYLDYSSPPSVPEDESTHTRYCAFGPIPSIVNDLRGVPATDLLFFGRPDVMTRVLNLACDLGRYDLPTVVAPRRPRNLLNTYCGDIGVDVALIDYVRPRDFDILRPE